MNYLFLRICHLFEGFAFEGSMFSHSSKALPSQAVCSSQALPVINPMKHLVKVHRTFIIIRSICTEPNMSNSLRFFCFIKIQIAAM